MLGFYDSGVGGLTVVDKFLRLRPNVQVEYLADAANCPLGNKSDADILEITRSGVEFLFSKGCDLVILACNTATSIAVRHLQQNWLPDKHSHSLRNILGVIKPVTEELVKQRKYAEPILVLATEATCRSEFYQQELKVTNFKHYDCVSFRDLAVAIEQQDDKLIERSLAETLDTINIQNYKSFVLACTHYPIVINQIEKFVQSKISNKQFQIIDQSVLVAHKLDEYLNNHSQYNIQSGKLKIYINQGKAEEYSTKVSKLFPQLIFEVIVVK